MKLAGLGGKIASLFGALALAGCATGPSAPEAQTPRPAMWSLADEDTTIYLFGTFHLLPEGQNWRTPAMERAMAASDELVLEVAEVDDPAAIAPVMAELGISAGLPKLVERVPADERAALEAMVKESGIPMIVLDRMETWAASLALMSVSFRRLGLSGELGVESGLSASYKGASKPVRGLETPREQLGFFDTLPEESQRALLISVLDDPEEAKAQFAAMLAAWSRGDVNAIARTFNEDVTMTPALRDALLKKRNARWAEWLAKRLDEPGTIFVAVGAGHLAGDDSVLAMLAERGLGTKRIQ